MWCYCWTLRMFGSSHRGDRRAQFGNSAGTGTGRCLDLSILLLGFLILLPGCSETEAPAQQQVYQPIPRLSAEDENLIFGDATHVDIYEQLSVGSSEAFGDSGDPLPENPSRGDADSFFNDKGFNGGSESNAGGATPIFGDQAPPFGLPVIGGVDSIFGDEKPVGETPLTEKKPLSDPAENGAELGSLESQP